MIMKSAQATFYHNPFSQRQFRQFLTVLILGAILSGCAAVGPNYVPPESKAPDDWHTELEGGLLLQPASPEILARWWTTLDDPLLSSLLDRAAQNNLDLRKAMLRVREARARRGISEASRFPTLDGAAAASVRRTSENSGTGKETDTYSVEFDAGWEIDVFGGIRRGIEAADADLGATEADLHDVLVSLLAEVALNYIEARTYQVRLEVAQANIRIQTETLTLNRSRFEVGLANELVVQQAQYNLESTRSQIPALRVGLDGVINRLAVLLGEYPGALHPEIIQPRPIPVAPATIVVGIPLETLRNRPDIKRAERNLAAQTARIGVATADLYPKFRLSGFIGLESFSAGDLFTAGSRTWQVGPGMSWRLFDAGAIRRNIEVQTALQEQALAAYEAAMLNALEEVENAMIAFSEEQKHRQSLLSAAEAASRAVTLAQDLYKAGLVDFSNVLDAQRSMLSFQSELARSDGAVTSNLVRLYKALGGGWETVQ